ncbi:cyclase family protein [Microvirga tunisiensis]|uniref:Cyclase family protein n=1 Tax=Microvirga tunisiensis TaxID=2108360 RepID=A0A5N7MAP8_9HYPH|nr:cyclase family protein [Microvirga tunisiensis]MPR05548.1 cyclase family protein [Microvirga tunisiensis]MPR23748.1 cyclase family protein [Microvirga tunisiensis]
MIKEEIERAFRELSNWGRWGVDDQIGTLNNVTPQKIAAAARLIREGRVFALGASLKWPLQSTPNKGRWNVIHSYMQDGADAHAAFIDGMVEYSDDAIHMPVQCSTHWDALCHTFHGGQTYNGGDARDFRSKGPPKLGIEHTANRMAGRGVLLDIARFKSVDHLENGYTISNQDLDDCAAKQGVSVGQGDFVIIRTGYQERFLNSGNWHTHSYSAAPGVAFENCYWLKEKDVAAIASDTYAVEVVPASADGYGFPWHSVAIPSIGVTVGEMLYVKELAEDCARDGIYTFFFCAPPLNLPGGTGSPINPQAIK